MRQFWKFLFKRYEQYDICDDYVLSLNGGTAAQTVQGAFNAIANNMGAFLIQKWVPRIGFHNRQIEIQVQVICIVFLCYYVIAVLPLVSLVKRYYLPPPLSTLWYNVYGSMIISSLIVTSFLPYVGIILNWFFNCLMKKPPSDQYINTYRTVRKHAHLVTISFIVFTYGFAMPILFLVATISLLGQYLLDKLLLTYYYRQNVNHNDQLTKMVINAIKYAPILLLVVGGATLN